MKIMVGDIKNSQDLKSKITAAEKNIKELQIEEKIIIKQQKMENSLK